MNKEIISINRSKKAVITNSSGDDYDQEDEAEFGSERAIINGKNSDFRRSGPHTEATKHFKCKECAYDMKDKVSFDSDNDLRFHQIYEHKEKTQ